MPPTSARSSLRSAVLAAVVLLGSFAAAPVAAQPPTCLPGGSGASLLYPYFEVDLTSASGLTTLISINDQGASPLLARVVLWTDWAVPTLAFDIHLKPFDVQTLNLRDVFNGILPSTGQGEDLSALPGCAQNPPSYTNPALGAAQRDVLRTAHTGLPHPLDLGCFGQAHGDGHARGYITVDVVGGCSGIEVLFPSAAPSAPGYFDPPTPLAQPLNSLWGDFFFVDPSEDSAQGEQAVAIWSGVEGSLPVPDTYTFYGRYVSWIAFDNRVPLPERWQVRYLNGGPFTGGTDLIVWRDTKAAPEGGSGPHGCGSPPSWHPLREQYVHAYDEAGNQILNFSDSAFFPLATQRVPVTDLGALAFGRLELGLSHGAGPYRPAQAWVMPVITAAGRYSVSFAASPWYYVCGLDPD